MRYVELSITCALMATLFAAETKAQESQTRAVKDTNARWSVGATQFRGGSMSLGLDRLNADLRRNNRPTFANSIPTFGISTYARRGRLLFGASVDGTLRQRSAQSGWVTKLSAGSATLDAGVALIDVSRIFVYSMASLGVRSTSLHFERTGDFTYSDGLGDPARGLDLSSKGLISQLGVSAERRFETRRTGPFALAVQTGMARPFGSASSFGENRVRQTPGQKSGSYVRIALAKPLASRARVRDTLGAALLSVVAW